MIIYNSFGQLMTELTIPFHRTHPDWIRLDGWTSGGNRTIFAQFYYQGRRWKIHSDTHFDRLFEAYEIIQRGEDPFEIKPTRNKGQCLDIKGRLRGAKFLYIYLNE